MKLVSETASRMNWFEKGCYYFMWIWILAAVGGLSYLMPGIAVVTIITGIILYKNKGEVRSTFPKIKYFLEYVGVIVAFFGLILCLPIFTVLLCLGFSAIHVTISGLILFLLVCLICSR